MLILPKMKPYQRRVQDFYNLHRMKYKRICTKLGAQYYNVPFAIKFAIQK